MASKNSYNSILSFMTEKDRDALIALGQRQEYKKRTCLFMQGDLGDSLYIIQAGDVSISTLSEDGREIVLQVLSAGDVFGEIAMFDQSERTASAFAEANTVLVAIDRGRTFSYLDKNPALYRGIINLLCKRLRWSSKLVESFVFTDGMERLITRLIYLAEYHNHQKQAVIAISQENLAKMLGLSREAVNKNLQQLQEKGLLSLERKKIIIPDLSRLNAFREERKE